MELIAYLPRLIYSELLQIKEKNRNTIDFNFIRGLYVANVVIFEKGIKIKKVLE